LELLSQAVACMAKSSVAVPTGAAAFVSVTYDGANVAFYVNGANAGGGTAAQTFRYPGSFGLGIGFLPEVLSGSMQDARIYNNALSPSAIMTLYSSGPAQ
jgi:hypothetical protein